MPVPCARMMCASVTGIGFLTSLLTAIPPGTVGGVQSAAGFVAWVVQPLGPLAGGLMLTAHGARTTYLALCAEFLVCACCVSWAPLGAAAAVRTRR